MSEAVAVCVLELVATWLADPVSVDDGESVTEGVPVGVAVKVTTNDCVRETLCERVGG